MSASFEISSKVSTATQGFGFLRSANSNSPTWTAILDRNEAMSPVSIESPTKRKESKVGKKLISKYNSFQNKRAFGPSEAKSFKWWMEQFIAVSTQRRSSFPEESYALWKKNSMDELEMCCMNDDAVVSFQSYKEEIFTRCIRSWPEVSTSLRRVEALGSPVHAFVRKGTAGARGSSETSTGSVYSSGKGGGVKLLSSSQSGTNRSSQGTSRTGILSATPPIYDTETINAQDLDFQFDETTSTQPCNAPPQSPHKQWRGRGNTHSPGTDTHSHDKQEATAIIDNAKSVNRNPSTKKATANCRAKDPRPNSKISPTHETNTNWRKPPAVREDPNVPDTNGSARPHRPSSTSKQLRGLNKSNISSTTTRPVWNAGGRVKKENVQFRSARNPKPVAPSLQKTPVPVQQLPKTSLAVEVEVETSFEQKDGGVLLLDREIKEVENARIRARRLRFFGVKGANTVGIERDHPSISDAFEEKAKKRVRVRRHRLRKRRNGATSKEQPSTDVSFLENTQNLPPTHSQNVLTIRSDDQTWSCTSTSSSADKSFDIIVDDTVPFFKTLDLDEQIVREIMRDDSIEDIDEMLLKSRKALRKNASIIRHPEIIQGTPMRTRSGCLILDTPLCGSKQIIGSPDLLAIGSSPRENSELPDTSSDIAEHLLPSPFVSNLCKNLHDANDSRENTFFKTPTKPWAIPKIVDKDTADFSFGSAMHTSITSLLDAYEPICQRQDITYQNETVGYNISDAFKSVKRPTNMPQTLMYNTELEPSSTNTYPVQTPRSEQSPRRQGQMLFVSPPPSTAKSTEVFPVNTQNVPITAMIRCHRAPPTTTRPTGKFLQDLPIRMFSQPTIQTSSKTHVELSMASNLKMKKEMAPVSGTSLIRLHRPRDLLTDKEILAGSSSSEALPSSPSASPPVLSGSLSDPSSENSLVVVSIDGAQTGAWYAQEFASWARQYRNERRGAPNNAPFPSTCMLSADTTPDTVDWYVRKVIPIVCLKTKAGELKSWDFLRVWKHTYSVIERNCLQEQLLVEIDRINTLLRECVEKCDYWEVKLDLAMLEQRVLEYKLLACTERRMKIGAVLAARREFSPELSE